MKPAARVVVLALVAFGVAGALMLRQQRNDTPTAEPVSVAGGAHLVELGSTSCKSCKAIFIDERVVHAGGIPTKAEIEQWVRELRA